MENPVIAPFENTFEKNKNKAWLRHKNIDPLSLQNLNDNQLVRNRTLKILIS